MDQIAQDAPFSQELTQRLRVLEAGGRHLEGDVALGLQVVRPIHRGHATLSDQRLDPVSTPDKARRRKRRGQRRLQERGSLAERVAQHGLP
jgi:hypothetical protein